MAEAVQKYEPVFLEAVAHLLHDEGGYVDNPADPGGETNFGISKQSYPDVDIKNLTAEQATEIYYRD
jgi:lysozyme family protein